MYEALVARVRYHIQKASFMGLKDAESTLLLGEAADAIEELLSERDEVNADSWKTAFELERDEHRWIPVTERLPDARQFVLAWKDEKPKGFTCICFWMDNAGWAFKNITHWMPLPEPPKKEEGE